MNWNEAIVKFVTLIISLTVHEAAHAWVALLGGDRTGLRSGQVTLNPIPHIQREPFGMVFLPALVLYLSGGRWTMGYASTPIDPIWAWHHPRKAAVMAAAGPLANLVLAGIAFGVLVWLGVPMSKEGDAVEMIALSFLELNVVLFLFNLVPLPPLDGASILEGLFTPLRRPYDALRRSPQMAIVTMLITWRLVDLMIVPVFNLVGGWLRHFR